MKRNLKKLAIITTHPIQYNAPVFKLLAERNQVQVKVFYTWENSKDGVYDKKFGQLIKWDIPLLEGYEYHFVKNTSKDKGTHHFKGIINPGLTAEIEEWGADAVLIFGWKFHSHLKAMRYFKGKIPVIFRGDSTFLDQKCNIKSLMRKFMLKLVYKYIDYALYVGTNNKNYFLKNGLRENKLVNAPHAVDNDRFNDTTGEYELEAKAWRKDLNIEENEIVFLFAGKFEAKKNPEIIIKASQQLKDVKCKFILAGDGFLKEKLVQMAIYNPNIIFIPFQNQLKMPVLYRLCDVFILPSCGPFETWGLGVNEAMACGKPVIVSDKVGCAIDLVQNDVNGYIFESENMEEFIARINQLNRSKLDEFGRNSIRIIENYTFKKMLLSIETLINKTIYYAN